MKISSSSSSTSECRFLSFALSPKPSVCLPHLYQFLYSLASSASLSLLSLSLSLSQTSSMSRSLYFSMSHVCLLPSICQSPSLALYLSSQFCLYFSISVSIYVSVSFSLNLPSVPALFISFSFLLSIPYLSVPHPPVSRILSAQISSPSTETSI